MQAKAAPKTAAKVNAKAKTEESSDDGGLEDVVIGGLVPDNLIILLPEEDHLRVSSCSE